MILSYQSLVMMQNYKQQHLSCTTTHYNNEER